MRRILILTLAFAGACASGGASESSETTSRQAPIYTSSETGTILGDQPHATVVNIAAPPAAVWVAVKKVYGELEIPVTVESPGTRQIGNPNFVKLRNMGGQSMVNWVDCGTGMTGPKAASYRIYGSLLTDVIPDGKGGTKLQTTFVPMGQDVEGGSSDRIPCGTTGRFEQLVLTKVKEAVSKS
ncbi:MAG TPA: hypothetical protein VGM50_09395 [Gemmatimonadaceae bacterium]|jgi:hypothetical protein